MDNNSLIIETDENDNENEVMGLEDGFNNKDGKFSISKYKFDEKLETFFIRLTGGKDSEGKPVFFTPMVPKILYFFLFYLFGTQRPFVPIYFREIGVEPKILGLILLFPPLISFIFSPIWSGIADSKNAHKLVFLLMTVGTGFCFFLLNFVSSHVIATIVVLTNAVFWAPIIPLADSTCYKILGTPFKELYGKQRMYGSIGFCISAILTGTLISYFGTVNVAWINYPIGATVLFTFTLLCFNTKPISNLFNKNDQINDGSQLLKANREQDQEQDQEKDLKEEEQEIFNNSNNNNNLKKVRDNYIITTSIEKEEEEEEEEKEEEEIIEKNKKISFFKGVLILLSNPKIAIILFNCIIIATGMSVCNNYLALIITDERYFNSSTSLVGFASILNVTFEILFFYFGKQLLMKIGIFKLIILSHCALITRVVAYSKLLEFKANGWCIVPVELLHGIVFASCWNSGSSIINSNSPPGLEATGQSLFFGVYMGFGTSLGALIGGVLLDAYGPITMFQFVAAVVTLGLFIFLIAEFLLYSKDALKKKKQKEIELEEQKQHHHYQQQQQQHKSENNNPILEEASPPTTAEDIEEEKLNLRFNQFLKDELLKNKELVEDEVQCNNLEQ
ncbi:hypothetical protein RB653_007460 [Dictyostelium firmibasis]|uniref:Major facilitator superfamily associated domain-containing protein n=1 Tax=Dictyostelium firmibasis TaxID=79012 RepID=A0AAN7YM23_9MYCE